jgi:Ca2+-binding EF-hand superfamily protein
MDPVISALDANSDGVIDQNEIAGASAALKKLDKNGDGKLTQEELRPNLPPRVRPGQPQANAEQAVTRLMQYDKNGDGKLSKEELPERMQSLVDRGDADKDGFLSKDEILKLSATQTGPTTNGRGGEGRAEHDDD